MQKTLEQLEIGDLILVGVGLGRVIKKTKKRAYVEEVCRIDKSYMHDHDVWLPGTLGRRGNRETFVDMNTNWSGVVYAFVVKDEKTYRRAVAAYSSFDKRLGELHDETEETQRERERTAIRVACGAA